MQLCRTPGVHLKAQRRSSTLLGVVAALAISLWGMTAHAANPTDTVDTLLRRADKALYAAKQAGRNCCKLWEADL